MTGQDFIVPPRSWDRIAEVTENVRDYFSLINEPYFPVMELMERVLDQKLELFHFEVASAGEMKGAEGYTDPNGAFIMLREDVYEAACAGDGRARFTAAHELGHYFMHTNVPLARAKPEEKVKPFRLSEPQANQFAAELLMPRRFFGSGDDENDVIGRHGVSYEAASNRLSFLRNKGVI